MGWVNTQTLLAFGLLLGVLHAYRFEDLSMFLRSNSENNSRGKEEEIVVDNK